MIKADTAILKQKMTNKSLSYFLQIETETETIYRNEFRLIYLKYHKVETILFYNTSLGHFMLELRHIKNDRYVDKS